ncbi:MAG: hypothetical protein NT033_10635 [Candidatus Omnitrophica bacterium]|nr:hypothetical protein [Candidatus Omnitrophota bacterium]
MAGRKEGFVYSRVNPLRIRFDEVKEVIYNRPEEVHSQLNTSYATILNLYEKYKEDIYKIYPLSLHYFQSRAHEKREALRLIEAKLKILKELNYIYNGTLTQKGLFAKTVYGYELILAELYEQKILEQLDEFGLGVISCAVVFEPRKNQHMPSISKASRRIKIACEEIYEEIKDKIKSQFDIFQRGTFTYYQYKNKTSPPIQ